MGIKYDVVAVRNVEGRDKPIYTKIGVVLATKKGGFALKLEQVPVGWDGWAQLYEPKPDEAKPARTGRGAPPDDDGDSIPF